MAPVSRSTSALNRSRTATSVSKGYSQGRLFAPQPVQWSAWTARSTAARAIRSRPGLGGRGGGGPGSTLRPPSPDAFAGGRQQVFAVRVAVGDGPARLCCASS